MRMVWAVYQTRSEASAEAIAVDARGYPLLIVGSALTGAAVAVVLTLVGAGGGAIDGAVGFCVAVWIIAWGYLRRRPAKRPPS